MRLTLIPSPFALDKYGVGVGRAPAALLNAGLVSALKSDGHEVAVAEADYDLGPGLLLVRVGRNLARLAEAVSAARQAGSLPVVLGGDCPVAIGVAAGLRRALHEDFGIAWFDAHGDFNTPDTSLSLYLGGMPLACTCGRGLAVLREAAGLARPVDEANVVLVGVRDLDPPEKALLESTPARVVAPAEAAGFAADERPTYLHFDIDALDVVDAPGVNYPAPNGLGLAEALMAARRVRPHLAAFSLTAADPDRDQDGRTIESALVLIRGILKD